MTNLSEAKHAMTELIRQARSFQDVGDIAQALASMDKAIHIAETNGIPPFQTELRRARIADNRICKYSSISSIIERAVNYFQQENDTLGQIDMLLYAAKAENNPDPSKQLLVAENLANSYLKQSIDKSDIHLRSILFTRKLIEDKLLEIIRLKKIHGYI